MNKSRKHSKLGAPKHRHLIKHGTFGKLQIPGLPDNNLGKENQKQWAGDASWKNLDDIVRDKHEELNI